MLVRRLRVVDAGHDIDGFRGDRADAFRPVPVVPPDQDRLEPLPARHYLVQLSVLGLAEVVVGADLERAAGHDEDVVLAPFVPVPGPDDAGLGDREVDLYGSLLAEEFGPILSEDLGERATLVDIPLQVDRANSGQHGDSPRGNGRIDLTPEVGSIEAITARSPSCRRTLGSVAPGGTGSSREIRRFPRTAAA